MARFLKYLKSANILGFALTIASLPLMVVNPDISTPFSKAYVITSIWFSVFAWAFLTFLRIALTFGKIVAVKDQEPFFGA